MKAKIYPDKAKNNAVNMSRERELVEQLRAVIVDGDNLRELVDARLYMGRSNSASTVYCSVWVHAPEVHISGRGTAGGYGYHKTSAALQAAFTAAGVEFYGMYCPPPAWCHVRQRVKTPEEMRAEKRKADRERAHFGGAGDSAMRDAVMAAGLELKRMAKLRGRVFVV